MNPFDLRGPEFLAFYLALGVVVVAVAILRRRIMEPRGALQGRFNDPLALAYLRGGPREAVAVSLLGLLERGAAEGSASLVKAVKGAAVGALAPLDAAILKAVARPRPASSLAGEPGVREALDVLRSDLEERGLLPDRVRKVARWLSALTGIGLLAGVALSKIDVALGRGRTNIGFLILLWIAFTAVLLWKASPRRTPRGERVLRDLTRLLARTRENPGIRTKAGGEPAYATNDLLMIAAVFGLTALPSDVRSAHAGTLPTSSGFSSSGGGCGSSSDGGGDGGGGGGGGGCGGCGGGGD